MDSTQWSRTFLLFALGLFLTAGALICLPVTAANFDAAACGSLFQPENNQFNGVTDGDGDTFQFIQECRDALDTRLWMTATAVTPGVVALLAAAVVRSLRRHE